MHRPIATRQDVEALRPLDPAEDLQYVYETIRLLVKELRVPLIGFAGAPYTLSSYLIEGGPYPAHSPQQRALCSVMKGYERPHGAA